MLVTGAGLAASGADAAFPGRNGRIAVVVSEECGSNCERGGIATVLPTGGPGRPLTRFGGPDGAAFVDPAFSPDGLLVAVTGSTAIHLIRADGRGRARRLTKPSSDAFDSEPDWSRDGRSVVYERSLPQAGSRVSLVRLYRQGRSKAVAEGGDPALSVAGEIAFVRDGSVYRMGADGADMRRVAGGHSPEWSPNGHVIAFVTARGAVATVNRDGRGLHRLAASGVSPAFSPDGRLVTFARSRDPAQVRVVPAGGGKARSLLSVPNSEDLIELADLDWQPIRR